MPTKGRNEMKKTQHDSRIARPFALLNAILNGQPLPKKPKPVPVMEFQVYTAQSPCVPILTTLDKAEAYAEAAKHEGGEVEACVA